MLNLDKFMRENIRRGDLAEVALTPDARRFMEGNYFFLPDPKKDIDVPGRIHAGYVIDVQSDSISLSSDWNKPKDEPEYGVTTYYFKALDSCKLIRRAKKKGILNSLFGGLSVIGRAYGSLSGN